MAIAWEQFRRFYNGTIDGNKTDDFYGCVNAEGYWFDSALLFETAVHWCCAENGKYDLTTEQELRWMDDVGIKLGLSVIHGTIIKRMYEAGLIK